VHGWRASISARGTSAARRGHGSPGVVRPVRALAAAALLMAPLAGCSELGIPGGDGGPPTTAPSAASADASGAPPVLVPGGTAEENRPLFDAVSGGVVAADAGAGGRAFVDALVAAGFDRAALEVTDDTTAIGRAADSVQFAVRLGDGCIIGERSASGYGSVVAPVLGTGRCLVGETRAIDW